jgi:glycosyltransferase involved in cell wall biosynthesis
MIFANLRYLSFWQTLLLCRLLKVRVYARGHGLFKKTRANAMLRAAYRAALVLVDTYICYTPGVKLSFQRNGCADTKLRVVENSFVNDYCVTPSEKLGTENGILFIGRLRRHCEVGILLKAVARLVRDDGFDLHVHVVGDGEERAVAERQWGSNSWLHFHGRIYDSRIIQGISRTCFAGCYPGNAGLSAVHMMSLSLPPIVHDNMRAHGPEGSYVRHRANGLLFDHANAEQSLYETIKYVVQTPRALRKLQERAFATYGDLTSPSQAERLAAIIGAEVTSVSA